MADRLKGKVAIVTGGGRGIGKSVALSFAREGASVVVNAAHMETAGAAAKEIQGIGGKAVAVPGDVSQKKDVDAIVKAALDNFGKVDILVNSAGITRDLPVYKITEDDWDRVIDICLKGAFLCTQAVTNWMTAQARKEKEEGKPLPARKIINITSGAVRGNPGQANYGAAKAGIIGLTRSNAKEFARFNILVNAISPVALTAMTQHMIESFTQRVPLGRLADPDKEIAPVFVFLASEDANYITGQVIGVNGGLDVQY